MLLHLPRLYRYGILSPNTAGRAVSLEGDFLHDLQPPRSRPRLPSDVIRAGIHLLRDLQGLQAAVPREIVTGSV